LIEPRDMMALGSPSTSTEYRRGLGRPGLPDIG
jgi:hypothetical protein